MQRYVVVNGRGTAPQVGVLDQQEDEILLTCEGPKPLLVAALLVRSLNFEG